MLFSTFWLVLRSKFVPRAAKHSGGYDYKVTLQRGAQEWEQMLGNEGNLGKEMRQHLEGIAEQAREAKAAADKATEMLLKEADGMEKEIALMRLNHQEWEKKLAKVRRGCSHGHCNAGHCSLVAVGMILIPSIRGLAFCTCPCQVWLHLQEGEGGDQHHDK